MAIAETAQLAVNLTLGGNFTGGLASAESSLGRFNATAATSGAKTGILSGAFTTVERGAARMGGALSHAGGQIKGLITGPLGLIGLTGGLLSFGGAIGSTLGKLNDLAFGTEKLIALTGDSAQTTSTLIAATEKYGITLDKLTVTAGFYEKTVGKLNETTAKQTAAGKSAELQNLELVKAQRVAAGESTKRIDLLIKEQKARDQLAAATTGQGASLTKLQALEKQYGVTLTDSTGKALPFDQALLSVADVYSKSTDKATAATLAATLFGRSYTGLIPILALGRQGIIDLETEAAKMGLQLSDKNVADFAAYRNAIRGSQEAISGLQVAIGLDLLPTIVDLANGLRSFVTTHKGDILNFVNGLVSGARTAASAVGAIAGGLQSAWNAIPPELRDFLVKGLVADRTVKFLFGFSPIGSIVGGIETAIKNALIGAATKTAATSLLGKLVAQHVWVDNPGFGGPGANPIENVAGKAAGLFAGFTAADFAVFAGLALVPVIPALVVMALNDPKVVAAQQYKARQGTAAERGLNPANVAVDYTGPRSTALPPGVPMNQYGAYQAADKLAAVTTALIDQRASERADWTASIEATKALTGVMRHAPWLSKLEESWRKAGQTMHDKIKAAIAGLSGPNGVGAASFLGSKLGNAGFGAGGYNQALAVLATLKSMNQSLQVVAAEREITARLPRLKLDRDDLAAAEKIAQSSDPKNKKLDELNRILADLRAHGDRTTQKKVQDVITAVKHQKFTVVAPINIRVTGGGGEAGRTVNRTVSRSGEWVAV